MLPATIASPGPHSIGIDSPVTADTSSIERPSRTTPSVTRRAPARNTVTSPAFTESVSTSTTSPSRRTVVVAGTSSRTARSPRRARVMAHSSSASDTENGNANDAASASCPSTSAPAPAIVISVPTSIRPCRHACNDDGTNVAPPTITATQNATVATAEWSVSSPATPANQVTAETPAATVRHDSDHRPVTSLISRGGVAQHASPTGAFRAHQRVIAQPDLMADARQQRLGRYQHFAQPWVSDRIEHLPPITWPIGHQPAPLQTRQVIRHVRLRRTHHRHQISHPPLPIEQRHQDRQTGRVTQTVEQASSRCDLSINARRGCHHQVMISQTTDDDLSSQLLDVRRRLSRQPRGRRISSRRR